VFESRFSVWVADLVKLAADMVSWPRERRSLTIEKWPRDEARWREVLLRPMGEGSGFSRRVGWERRMRRTSSVSAVRIARRRRREGSILN
jgi:hypothetical protein